MRLGRIATLAMLAIAAVAPAMAQTITRSGEPFNPPVVSVRRYVTRTVDSLGGHRAGMRDSAVWETPAQALPVPMPVGGMYAVDTTSRIFQTDANGYVYSVDPYAPPWSNDVYTDAINDTVSVPGWGSASNGTIAASFTAESTFIYPMAKSGFHTCQLAFSAGADSANLYADTTLTGVFAIQVRGHFSANYDTSTTFPWASWSAFGRNDSLDVSPRGGMDMPFASALWPGEHLVRYRLSGKGYATAASYAGGFFSSPGGFFVDLGDSKGGEPVPPWMSVRIRCLGVYSNATLAMRKLVQPHIHLSLAFGM